MKRVLFLTFAILFLIVSAHAAIAQEISLFNSNGEAKAYIDTGDEDNTIYLWDGTPVCYLKHNSDDCWHIYGFNGKHIGWFEDGIIRDHNGDAVGFQKGAVNMYTSYEPYKSYKQYKPYKSYREYAPYKPYYSNSFSRISLTMFLRIGRD